MNNPAKESEYLIKSISKSFNCDIDILQSLKYEIDKHIYYYGNHFSKPTEKKIDLNYNTNLFKKNIKKILENESVLKKIKNWQEKSHFREDKRDVIVCNAYFGWSKYINTKKIIAHPPLWMSRNNANPLENILREQCRLISELMAIDFKIFTNKTFIDCLKQIKHLITQYYSHNSIKAILIPYTLPFFENISLKIFKSLNKKTFLVDHGFTNTTMYNSYDSFDFYVAWGGVDNIDFTSTWISKNQFIITGHPEYKIYNNSENLKFSFEDILILTRPMSGAPNGSRPIYQNRGIMLDFVYRIQSCLRELGVVKARLRPHPSESAEWYHQFVDTNFFTIDTELLNASIQKSTLVIGHVSSMLFDSLIRGVNYTCFIPSDYIESEPYYHLYTPPFDGNNTKIPIAYTDKELIEILKNKKKTDKSILTDYIKFPFDQYSLINILEQI